MGKAKVTELKRVDVDFVSFVNEGANGMKFQIFKSKGFVDKQQTAPARKDVTKQDTTIPQSTAIPVSKKPRYSMRELIENIVRGMFVDTRQPPVQPDTMLPQSADVPTVASVANDPPAPTETAKETPPMNEIQQSITAMRDDIIAAITGLRDAILAVTAPSGPNGQSDPDVAFSKDEKPPVVAQARKDDTTATGAANAQTQADSSAQAASEPTTPPASKTAESAVTPPTNKPDEIAALNGVVLALSKQVEALAGKIEIMAKERGLSNAIADGGEIPLARREVRKNAAGREIPDFTNIF